MCKDLVLPRAAMARSELTTYQAPQSSPKVLEDVSVQLGAKEATTGSSSLLEANSYVTKGIATRSKDATRGSWPYY